MPEEPDPISADPPALRNARPDEDEAPLVLLEEEEAVAAAEAEGFDVLGEEALAEPLLNFDDELALILIGEDDDRGVTRDAPSVGLLDALAAELLSHPGPPPLVVPPSVYALPSLAIAEAPPSEVVAAAPSEVAVEAPASMAVAALLPSEVVAAAPSEVAVEAPASMAVAELPPSEVVAETLAALWAAPAETADAWAAPTDAEVEAYAGSAPEPEPPPSEYVPRAVYAAAARAPGGKRGQAARSLNVGLSLKAEIGKLVERHPEGVPGAAVRASHAVGLSTGGRPTPLSLTPAVVPAARLAEWARDARHVATAAQKLVAAEPALRRRLGQSLPPGRGALFEQAFADADHLPSLRLDWMFEGALADDRRYLLRLVADAPGLHAEADGAVTALAAALAPRTAARLRELVPRNVDALWRSLVAREEAAGRATPRRLALAHAAGDPAQAGHEALASRLVQLGVDARAAVAETLAPDPDELVWRQCDVALLAEDVRVAGPPAAHLELLPLLAELAHLVTPAGEKRAQRAGLTDEELATLWSVLPWTRPFAPIATDGPHGEKLRDVVASTRLNPEVFVLKSARPAGGHAVIMGHAAETPAGQAAMAPFLSPGTPPTWTALCAAAAAAPAGTWFVQRYVPPAPARHLVLESGAARWRSVLAKASTFASLLDESAAGATGTFVPASASDGGAPGLVPLLTEEAAEVLLAELFLTR